MIIPSSAPSKSAAFEDPLPELATLLTGLVVKAVPLQIVAVWSWITGLGFTTTTTLLEAEHPLDVIV